MIKKKYVNVRAHNGGISTQILLTAVVKIAHREVEGKERANGFSARTVT